MNISSRLWKKGTAYEDADDEFTSRPVLQEFLRIYGAPHIASNGKEAVAAVRIALEKGESYDLVCMDIKMPGVDGMKALRQICEQEEAHHIS